MNKTNEFRQDPIKLSHLINQLKQTIGNDFDDKSKVLAIHMLISEFMHSNGCEVSRIDTARLMTLLGEIKIDIDKIG